MADERILTAPTVEQNVNITISGEEKLHDFASTLNDLAENKALNKYWKTQEELIKDVTNACEIYSKNIDNKKNATELLKFANALKAVSGTDLSTLFPNFKDISHYIEQATLKIGSLDKAFSVQNFQKVFESFKTMQAYSLDLDRMFKHFEIKPDVTELENSFKESQSQVTRLTEKIERLRDRLESAESGSGIDVLRQKCEELEYQLDEIHENAQKTFQSFLQLNNLDSYGFSDLTESYVENVKNGYLTAEQAIANFKREYAYLFDDANFDTTQLKDFASTLNQVSNTVSAISNKLENLEFGPGSGSNANNQAINQVSTDIDSLFNLLNGIDFQGKSGNIQEMYVALANVLTILKEIAQTDQDSLYSIFGIIQNLAKLDDLKINKTSLDNLANCLERIASIENGNALNNLSNVDLSKFNDLHITKAPLANLAEYLPSIANINVEILESLSKIDFKNFNELQTNKAVLENLKSFASMLREAFNGVPDEEGNGLEEISKSATAASKAKNSFSDANENVQKSIDESVPKLQAEADLFKGIADNAKAAANAKEKFAKENVNNGANNSGKSNSPQSKKPSVKNNQNSNQPTSNSHNINKDDIEKQTLVYNELMNTIHKYERVKKQLAKGEISEKDGNKQLYLLKKDINDLQKNPLLSKKQLQSSEFELQRIDERIVDINKNIQKTNSSKELAERRKLIRDAIKDIDNLKKAATELNNAKASNAKNGDLENYVREKEAEFELAKAQAEKSKNYLNNVDIDGLSQAELSKIIDSLEKFDTAADGSAKSVDNLNKAIQTANQNKLTNIDSFIKSSESYLKQSLNRPGPQDQSELYKEHLADLKTNLNDLKQLKEKVSKQDIVSAEDTNQLDFLQAKVDGLIRSLKAMYASEKGSDSLQRSKLKDTIEQYMNLNSNISKHFKNELKRLINELDFGGPNVNVKALRDEFLALKSAIRGAGQEGKAFLDVVKDKAWYGLAATLGTYFGLDDVINLVQEGARQVINLNSEIVDLAKVSEQTTKQIYENFSDYSSIAKDIGATISDTIDATANWSRNGYNIPDAQDLAEVALIYKNVGDNIDISAANDSLISTLRGFKMEANEAMKIVDVFNEVSNNEAITSSGIGEALQRSAASFEVAGTSLEKAVALVTATNSVIQNPDKVGNMWKVVSARIRGAKTELLEMGEETEGMVESTSKLRALVKGITGFDITEDENTFKDIYEIVLGIGKAWDDVNDIDKAALLEALAGKQQSNSLAAALSNTGILEKSYKEAMQSAGSAMREQEKYQESIQYSIDRAKASLEELSNTTINSESLKDFIDFGNGVIQVLNQMIEKFGLMPGVVAAATAFLGRGKLEQQFCPVWG